MPVDSALLSAKQIYILKYNKLELNDSIKKQILSKITEKSCYEQSKTVQGM